jgi:hypothetical protein
MRVILVSVAVLFVCVPMLAQQSPQAIPVPRTFIPDEPQPCKEFDGMAARLDAVYKTEEISQAEYDQGTRKNKDSTEEEGLYYFIVEKNKYQRVSLLPDKRAEFIRWYAVEGGRGQMSVATTQCNIELQDREGGKYDRIYAIRQLQNTMTVSQAERLLSDVALEGQNVLMKALQRSEAERHNVVDRYNKLVDNVNAYHDAVNNLVATVNSMMKEYKPSGPALTFNFNFVPPRPLTCTGSPLPFTNSTAYLANVYTSANATATFHCQ